MPHRAPWMWPHCQQCERAYNTVTRACHSPIGPFCSWHCRMLFQSFLWARHRRPRSIQGPRTQRGPEPIFIASI